MWNNLSSLSAKHVMMNERQIKVLNRLLDTAGEEFEQGINARKYQSLAKVSKATATWDLAELLEKGCLYKLPGGGRSTRYSVLLGRTEEAPYSGDLCHLRLDRH